MSASIVVGNSWQLSQINEEDRVFLDSEPYVFCCNEFLEHWRLIGFRPTVWMMGDCFNHEICIEMRTQLKVLNTDHVLRERLKHYYLCLESERAANIAREVGAPVTLYTRGWYENLHQRLAKNIFEPLYHLNTMMDLINMALIMNPTGEIRLIGCQRGLGTGHFYDGGKRTTEQEQFPEILMWDALAKLYRQSVPLVDCNPEHSALIPDIYNVPRGTLRGGVL